uniref:Uncharacterized protein n=1 Tax=Setaria digitata TaxID=48799 RepID=A0A915Q0N8_9BILA
MPNNGTPPVNHPTSHDDFFTFSPDSVIKRTQSAWSITRDNPLQPEFSQSEFLGHDVTSHPLTQSFNSSNQASQQQILREPSSLYFDDRRYRFLRTFTPAPYRSPLHTSTTSLPDIKEVTTEENDSSCSSSMEQDKNAVMGRNTRKSSEQNLELESSSNLVTNRKSEKGNVDTARRYQYQEPEASWSSDTHKKSFTAQPLHSSGRTDLIYSDRTSHYNKKNQELPLSIITVQIKDRKSHIRDNYMNQNEAHHSGKSKMVQEACKNSDYPSETVSLRNLSDMPESTCSYLSDSSKQPKSILKQRLVSSSHNVGDNTLGRYIERIQINNNNPKKQEQQHHQQRCDDSVRINQPNPDSIEKNNKLYQVMKENLQQQKQRPQTPHNLPHASFNGPFFTLEEIHTDHQRMPSFSPLMKEHRTGIGECREEINHQMIRNQKRQNLANDLEKRFAHWLPSSSKQERERARSVPPSLKAKNITDPDRISEYRRQKELELEAIKLKEKKNKLWREKQARALELQERLYYEQAKLDRSSPVFGEPITESHEELRQIDVTAQKRQQERYFEKSPEPQLMRVYETRPITATFEVSEQQDHIFSPSTATWKRLYIVDQPKPVAKNEIITSEQLLEKERFNIDLLKRREAFIEKPKPEPMIFRTGKRWKPPPEQSYVWPHVRKAKNTEPGFESSSNYSTDSAAGRTVESTEFRWQPVVHDPVFKQEHKNFTPENSLPGTPRGFGAGPLDESAKRQIKNLVQPLPDGSHRPKPAFGGPRATPSGGIADWEKIYDLPPHSSTITTRETLRNVNVRGKLAAFENSSRQTTPSVLLHFNSSAIQRPSSSAYATNVSDSRQSPNVAQINRSEQSIQQQHFRQQQLHSPTSVSNDPANNSSRLHQQQRNEQQPTPTTNGSLFRQIDRRNRNQSNRTFSAVHPDSYYQSNRGSTTRLFRSTCDLPGCNHHQQRIPVFRSNHTRNDSQHQQQVQPAVSVATSRRLTRIPVGCTTDRNNPKIIEVQRLSSRTPTITQWQSPSNLDYLSSRS